MFLKIALLTGTALSISSLSALEADYNDHPHKLNFGITQFGYEYHKEDALYAGVDFKLSPLVNLDSESSGPKEFSVDEKDTDFSELDYWTNMEIRLGYNFSLGNIHNVVPYISVGYSHFNFTNKDFELKQLGYLSFGLKTYHTVGPIFQIGTHIRTYRNLMVNYNALGRTYASGKKEWKVEFGLPLIWHVGDTKQWEILLEPYYIQLPTTYNAEFLGTRLTFGYRF